MSMSSLSRTVLVICPFLVWYQCLGAIISACMCVMETAHRFLGHLLINVPTFFSQPPVFISLFNSCQHKLVPEQRLQSLASGLFVTLAVP